jgi:hypothetical protein
MISFSDTKNLKLERNDFSSLIVKLASLILRILAKMAKEFG